MTRPSRYWALTSCLVEEKKIQIAKLKIQDNFEILNSKLKILFDLPPADIPEILDRRVPKQDRIHDRMRPQLA